MSKKYYARVRIADCEYQNELACDIKTAYKAACSLARLGRRDHVRILFIVRDTLGNTIIRTYARYSDIKGEWIARHSSACRYSGYNGMGRYL